ncbi:MAG: glutamate--tRNA ligase, partial [Rhodospirillaceae bacterium]|nr:glutamate--tRNA ligase [Rhodospirillaceae bacterium]
AAIAPAGGVRGLREGVGLGAIAQPLRAALTGSTASPSIFEVMEVLGRKDTLRRLAAAASETVS